MLQHEQERIAVHAVTGTAKFRALRAVVCEHTLQAHSVLLDDISHLTTKQR